MTLQCKIKKSYSRFSLGVFPFALQSAFRVEPFLAHCLIPCSWFCAWQRLEKYFLVQGNTGDFFFSEQPNFEAIMPYG